jgi:hypothetical protein
MTLQGSMGVMSKSPPVHLSQGLHGTIIPAFPASCYTWYCNRSLAGIPGSGFNRSRQAVA